MRIRLEQTGRARVILASLFAVPWLSYMLHGLFSPSGFMQNHRASNGMYLYWAQNFLGSVKTPQEQYRPEFYFKEETMSLSSYSKRIQNLKKEGSDQI